MSLSALLTLSAAFLFMPLPLTASQELLDESDPLFLRSYHCTTASFVLHRLFKLLFMCCQRLPQRVQRIAGGKLCQFLKLEVGKSLGMEDQTDIWRLGSWDASQGGPAGFYPLLVSVDHTFLDGCHGDFRCDRQRICSFLQKSGFFAANEHATACTVEPVRTRNVELIAAEHRLAIGIIANEPAEGGEALSRSLHINQAFKDPAHIVSRFDDAVELDHVLIGVAPDGPGIRVPRIGCEI